LTSRTGESPGASTISGNDFATPQWLNTPDVCSPVQWGFTDLGLAQPYASLFVTGVATGYLSTPLKLVLIENPGCGGTLNHLGIEVASRDTVHAEITRLTGDGLFTEEELDTTCCFATQDKVWVTAPGSERWEVYTVLADSDTFGSTTTNPIQPAAGHM
jgi:hypothetical protein